MGYSGKSWQIMVNILYTTFICPCLHFSGLCIKDDTPDRGFRFREALHGVTKAPEMGENNETEVWDPVLITESWAPNDPLVIW